MSEFVQQLLTGVPTVMIGNLINILKNEPVDSYLSAMISELTVSGQNEHLSSLLAHKLSTNQISETHFGALNQMIIGYDRLWSEIDLLERIDWSVRFKNRILVCFKVNLWLHTNSICLRLKIT